MNSIKDESLKQDRPVGPGYSITINQGDSSKQEQEK